MAKEAIQAVLDAESKAASLLEEARAQAALSVDQAREEAATLEKDIVRKAEEEAAAMDLAAREAGEADGTEELEQARREAARFTDMTDAQLAPIVDYIVQKVVAYGHS